MSAADENTNAANSMRGGLSALADFLYRQKVQRPLVQAQTQQVGAETGLLGAQTAASQQATTQGGLMFPEQLQSAQTANQVAKAQAALAVKQASLEQLTLPSDLTINVPAPVEAPAPAAPAPAVPVSPFAAQLRTPDQGFSIKPLPSIAAPRLPTDNWSGSSQTNRNTPQTSSILSAPVRPGDSTIPGTAAGPVLPTLRTTPDLASTAGAPKASQFHLLSAEGPRYDAPTEPALPPVAAAPQVTTPGKTVSVLFPPHLLHNARWEELPDDVQAQLLKSGHAQMAARGVPVTDEELIGQFYRNQAKAIPMWTPQSAAGAGLVPTKFTPAGMEYERTFTPGGEGTGGLAFSQYGPVAEKAAAEVTNDQTRKDADQQYGSAITVERLARLAAQAEKTPGGNAGPFDAELLAAAAKGIDPAIRAKLGDAGALKLHTPWGQKIGAALDKYISGAGLPQSARDAFVKAARSDSESADQLASESVDRIIASYKHQYGIPHIVPPFSRGGNLSRQTLGNVNSSSVQAPGGGQVVPVHSQQEYKALARGTWYSDSNGTVRQKR